MKMMSVEELMGFWSDKAYKIAGDDSLNYKEQRCLFIEAYASYLFYKEAYEEHYEEAREQANYILGISED
ncbi:hypothetical protein JTZ62_04950 [Mammaliicoccus sciuri]|uniref:hypothetical protein n=1 Tax=Mammaliicoccus sciuri TaxID=1296 RepID=UPI0019D33C53|nr:hypothetical protein [Mammaliicoccus sciuri]QSN68508.1 hypothetical protein JTZ62_04950 [Mammaliicoccus sciuri]UIU23249.1 hypothetical protein LLZ87_04965 [Mammaliicoccus sciuri]UIU26155.1 hypothetical protein LLZ92_04965 [Mammaliicoccus sciuri]